MIPACDLQSLKVAVVLEDIGWENRNLVVLKVTARVAGCEVRTSTDDGRPRMPSTWSMFTQRR